MAVLTELYNNSEDSSRKWDVNALVDQLLTLIKLDPHSGIRYKALQIVIEVLPSKLKG